MTVLPSPPRHPLCSSGWGPKIEGPEAKSTVKLNGEKGFRIKISMDEEEIWEEDDVPVEREKCPLEHASKPCKETLSMESVKEIGPYEVASGYACHCLPSPPQIILAWHNFQPGNTG